MKNLLLFLSLIFFSCLSACVKEDKTIIIPVVGQRYNIKADHYIFNKGAYQPKSPALVVDLFTGPSGTPYAHIMAPIDWSEFALVSGHGVAEQTVLGNEATMRMWPYEGIVMDQPDPILWSIPTFDLINIK